MKKTIAILVLFSLFLSSGAWAARDKPRSATRLNSAATVDRATAIVSPETSASLLIEAADAGLFEDERPLGAHTLRRSFATLDLGQVRDQSAPEGHETIALDLFPDALLQADMDRFELRSEDSYSWFRSDRR